MHLLIDRGDSSLRLEKYYDTSIPRYAILSHTWGADDEEVTFKDLMEDTGKNKAGYTKIDFCRKKAASDGIQHFWVDTCCIDKANNTELSEAINSMFRWYENADKCYVYLSDVSTSGNAAADHSFTTAWKAAFRSSRWFTRGWTLQELIAPKSVEFFSEEGDRLGSKKSLAKEIHDITKIRVEALHGKPLATFHVEERMSWTNARETKRQEDLAYSLLGIFNVRMWLDYGEGRERAFERLREEIGKSSKRKRESHASTTPDTQLSEGLDLLSAVQVPSPVANLKPVPTWKTFVVAFDDCLDAKLDGHCMSRKNLAQMISNSYGGLTRKADLGPRIVDTLPSKPNKSHESCWRLYVYCAPCTQTLDLAFGIAGHIVGFNAIIRVDDRLQPHCCAPENIPDKLTTFSTVYSEIQQEWRIEHNFERSWISSHVDLPWLQQRAHRMKEDDRSSDISMETYFDKAYTDRTVAAVIVLAPARMCSALLASWPNENRREPKIDTGDIFELQYQERDHELSWISSFFGTIE
jgi:hypothetical protein